MCNRREVSGFVGWGRGVFYYEAEIVGERRRVGVGSGGLMVVGRGQWGHLALSGSVGVGASDGARGAMCEGSWGSQRTWRGAGATTGIALYHYGGAVAAESSAGDGREASKHLRHMGEC